MLIKKNVLGFCAVSSDADIDTISRDAVFNFIEVVSGYIKKLNQCPARMDLKDFQKLGEDLTINSELLLFEKYISTEELKKYFNQWVDEQHLEDSLEVLPDEYYSSFMANFVNSGNTRWTPVLNMRLIKLFDNKIYSFYTVCSLGF